MPAAAWVTLKQHRFEVGVAALGAIAIGAWGLAVTHALATLNVPQACIDGWLLTGSAGRDYCVGPMHAWGGTLAVDGEKLFTAMKVLPFGVGLLAGAPIVATELEMRTAQTAWSLNGSRVRWLSRQIAPIGGVIGIAVVFAAAAASAIQTDRAAWGQSAFFDIGLYGPGLVARAFGAFGLALLVGAIVGRSLPAFVLGAVLCLGLLLGVGVVRDAWLAAQESVPIGDQTTALTTGWAWTTPQGAQVTDEQAKGLVPTQVSALDENQSQAVHSIQWLNDHGYTLVAMGVTEQAALGWTPFDALYFTLAGLVGVSGAMLVVNRRRPA